MRIIIACMFSLVLLVVFDFMIAASDISVDKTSKFAQKLRNKVVGVKATTSLLIPSQTMRSQTAPFNQQDQTPSKSKDEKPQVMRKCQSSHFNTLNDMRNARAPQPLPAYPDENNLPPMFTLE